jgi:ABC-type uncharacterized transport system substrate-binding protein
MRRRDLLGGTLAAAALTPFGSRAQQKALLVVGYLNPTSPAAAASFATAFRQGLSDAGYFEGQNLAIEYRWAEGHYDRLPALAADLVGRKVNLIATIGRVSTLAAKSATSTIPIVFMGIGDPVEMGLVTSLARPGGNITGFSNIAGELVPKRLDLLSELVPHTRTIALLVNPNNEAAESVIRSVQEAASAKSVQLPILNARTEGEIDAAFATLVELHAGAILVVGDPFFTSRRDQFVALASHHAAPAMYMWRDFVAAAA